MEVVLECSGLQSDKDKGEGHIDGGGKKVLMCGAGSGDLKRMVLKSKDDELDGCERVV